MTTFTSVFGSDAVPPAGQSFVAIALDADTAYFWPELAVGDTLAQINEVTSSGAYSITLPAANLTSTGRDLLFRNVGGVAFTLKDNAGNTVATVAPGEAKYLYITNNSTAAGLWAVFTYGTGTSSADASALAGSGLTVSSGKLALTHDSVSSLADYTIQLSDRAKTVYFGNTGAVNCNLPAVSAAGDGFFFLLSNQGSGSVTVEPFDVETIDGLTNKALAPGESAFIICTSVGWLTVGYGRSTQFQFTKLVKDISTGSPFTLTAVEAQNKLLEFIGTATASVTVNVPSVVAIYYVQCNFAGAYQLTLKTASGAGVTLNNTDRVIAYCDGVNVVLAQTAFTTTNLSLVDGTAANPAIGFTLDPNTGIFRAGNDVLGFTAGGVENVRFGTSESLYSVPINWGSGVKTQTQVNLGIITAATGSVVVPNGTEGQRDLSPLTGYFRFNTTVGKFEGFNGTTWGSVGGGATGGGADEVFILNGQNVTANYTVPTGKNAGTFGPITINNGVTVTVSDGSVWTVV